MKSVRILKPWICGGKMPAVGSLIELDDGIADSGLERGLCEMVDESTNKAQSSAKPGRRKKSPR